jgi:peroxiredoxin
MVKLLIAGIIGFASLSGPFGMGWLDKLMKEEGAFQQNNLSQKEPQIGELAPDIVLNDVDGNKFTLSSLRGKVVLVDFWASWCGPCRRENPNVVQAYKKYKDLGFTVLSVSLDNNREKWIKAIEQDGMEWNHVSDLKGWQSEVAGLYAVRSIPATFLIDKEGKVIGKNLRGENLEKALNMIFKRSN